MPEQIAFLKPHLQGEIMDPRAAARAVLSPPLTVDTLGRRFRVEWDPQAPVTPLGQLVFFAQFLAAEGLFAGWVGSYPPRCTSPSASELTYLREELLNMSDLYAQRADAQKVYDALKNQWGWGGLTTQDLLRCQVAARNVALVINGWNLFVRCAEPETPAGCGNEPSALAVRGGAGAGERAANDVAADEHARGGRASAAGVEI